MKYTRPTYLNESIEISDVIQASTVAIAYVTRGTGLKDDDGNEIMVKATQVTVDVSGLF